MASWDGRLEFGIGFQRRGLAYFDNSKWLMVQINANRGFSFRSRMTDIRARGDVSILHQYAFNDQPGAIDLGITLRLPGVFGHPR